MVYIFILTIVSIFRYCKIIVIILIVKNNKDIILLIEKSGGDVGDYEVVGKACLGGGGDSVPWGYSKKVLFLISYNLKNKKNIVLKYIYKTKHI